MEFGKSSSADAFVLRRVEPSRSESYVSQQHPVSIADRDRFTEQHDIPHLRVISFFST